MAGEQLGLAEPIVAKSYVLRQIKLDGKSCRLLRLATKFAAVGRGLFATQEKGPDMVAEVVGIIAAWEVFKMLWRDAGRVTKEKGRTTR